MELAFLSAVEQARLVRSGEVSSTELVTSSLERIERLDPTLNAFVTVCGDEALAAARERRLDARRRAVPRRPDRRQGPRARPPASARRTRRARTPTTSRTSTRAVVRRIREAGFVIVGKTNTPEFGTVAFTESDLNGATRNPWNTELTPGGSSGGAAAAVAAGLVPDRPRHRRRRLDPHPRLVLRPLRAEALARTRLDRTVRHARGPLDRRSDDALGRGRGPSPRRPRRLRARRSVVGAAARATVRRDDARAARNACGSPSPRLRRSTCPSIRSASGRHAPPPSFSPSSATTSATSTPPWREPDLFDTFIAVWQVGPALHPVDEALLTPLNRGLVESRARASAADYGRRVACAADCSPGGSSRSGATSTSCSRRRSRSRRCRSAGRTRSRARSSSSCGTPSSRPFTAVANLTGLPGDVAPAPLDATPASRSASRRSARRPETRSCSASPPQIEAARPWADRRPPVS